MEHGHALLIDAIHAFRPSWIGRRGLRMLEIGTTRERHPGQDSTRVLAEFCRDQGWHFTTCDMDPANGEGAVELFNEMGVDFTAVAARGEEYIAAHRRAFDVVYLDAYDFDHGKHNEFRQSRYEEFLGSRIDQRDCEIMHLQAMRGLNRSGTKHCLVVIDDTWRDEPDGPWLGKGPMAVPWALEHGWDFLQEDPERRAVVLGRKPFWGRWRAATAVLDPNAVSAEEYEAATELSRLSRLSH
jgi:hypothetical protein